MGNVFQHWDALKLSTEVFKTNWLLQGPQGPATYALVYCWGKLHDHSLESSFFPSLWSRMCGWSHLQTCLNPCWYVRQHLRWLNHIEALCSVTCMILWRDSYNASFHEEALNSVDKVCHLIPSFYHKPPCYIVRKAHHQPSNHSRRSHTYRWPIWVCQHFTSAK